MSRKVRNILIVSIVLLIAGMALYPVVKRKWFGVTENLSESPSGKQQRSALTVNAKVLDYESLNETFSVRARLMPDEEVELSFETSGKITGIHFHEGTSVKKGDLLAKVNDNTLQAELQKLQAQVPLAQDRVSRQRALLDRDAVSQESFESVSTDLETLLADIDLVKARISQTELRAPFDGVIGLRQVSEGTYASPTTVISTLPKISPLKMEFSVNERQANAIPPGTRIKFTVDNDPLTVYDATVYALESRLDASTLTLRARALYDNPGGRIKPGISARIEFNLNMYSNTIVIPSLSTVAEMGRDIAYVYQNGYARQLEIRKGLRTESAVQVLSGLYRGDTLITTGVMQVKGRHACGP